MCNIQTSNVQNSHVNEYIDYRTSSSCNDNTRAVNLLKKLKDFESSISTPFQSFSEDQTYEFYKKLIIRSTPKQATPRIKAIKDFLIWMHDNDLIDNKSFLQHPFFRILNMPPEENGFAKNKKTISQVVSDADPELIRNTMIFSEKEFEAYCDTFFCKDNLEMERAIHCLIWSGVPIGSLNRLRKDDFNLRDRTVSFIVDDSNGNSTRETITVTSDYCIQAIKNAIDSSGYTIMRNSNRVLSKQYDDVDDPYIIRRTTLNKAYIDNNEDGRLRGIFSHISGVVKRESSLLRSDNVFKNKYVNLRNLYASGLFYRCYLLQDNKKALEILGVFRWPSYVAWLSAASNH